MSNQTHTDSTPEGEEKRIEVCRASLRLSVTLSAVTAIGAALVGFIVWRLLL